MDNGQWTIDNGQWTMIGACSHLPLRCELYYVKSGAGPACGNFICDVCEIRLVKARFTRGLESVVLRVLQL